jgi:hypothetical protein
MDSNDLSMYDYFKSIDLKPPHVQFMLACHENQNKIEREFKYYCGTTKYIFDALNFLQMKYSAFYEHFNLENDRPYDSLLWTAFIKNSYSLYAAFDLTEKGLYGSARIILRYIFEFLIVSKYVAVSNDIELYERWNQGETIWMSKDVLKKISKPDMNEIRRLWETLCGFAHTSIQSQQSGIKYEDVNKDDIELNYVFIWMLMEMSYHLLNRHILNSRLRYYLNEYGDSYEITCIQDYIREAFKYTKKKMSKESRSIIRNYKSNWTIISNNNPNISALPYRK